ncbi:MAG: hypothetical protein M5R41_06640 [Bacteroidia bacterium]|nr:hypothetical protein [Bacteroidia bacterium]
MRTSLCASYSAVVFCIVGFCLSTAAATAQPTEHGQATRIPHLRTYDARTHVGSAPASINPDAERYRSSSEGFGTHSAVPRLSPLPTEVRGADSEKSRDPASSSLFLIPTGNTLPAVSGTLGLAAPYIPYVALSVLPGLQLSAGGVYIFESDAGSDRAYYSYLILKNALYEDKNTSIAVGGALLFWGQEFRLGGRTNWDRVTVPGVFAVTTIGGEESAFTIGMGFADMAGGYGLGFDEGLLVGLGLGYETQLSPNWKLMTEHLSSVLTAGTLHTLGFRYFSGRAAFDLGLIVVPNGDITISGKKIPLVLPLLGVSIHIG